MSPHSNGGLDESGAIPPEECIAEKRLLVSHRTMTYKTGGELWDAEPMAVNPPSDDRSPWALAMEWSSRMTAIAMEMVLPPLGGYWLDHKVGTRLPVFLIVGVVLGFTVSMIQLCKLAQAATQDRRDHRKEPRQ
jgi:hypothetical protein